MPASPVYSSVPGGTPPVLSERRKPYGWIIGGLVFAVLLVALVLGANSYASRERTKAQALVVARAKQARAEEAAQARKSARTLLDEVTASIRRFQQEELSEAEVDVIKAQLRTKLGQAETHAARSIELEPEKVEGWVLRAHALRVSGDEDAARKAISAGLSRFPGDPGLKEQQEQL
jgi:Flp pilus assembly protein TadD